MAGKARPTAPTNPRLQSSADLKALRGDLSQERIARLQQYPLLTASRLYEMTRQRGYQGSLHHFRHMVALHRPC
jgi:hypothetical protein